MTRSASNIDLSHPLLQGVQGLWLPTRDTSGSGRLYDLSGRGRHGNIGSGVSWDQNYLNFTGSTDVDLGVLVGSETSAWTAVVGFRRKSASEKPFDVAGGDENVFILGEKDGWVGAVGPQPHIYIEDGDSTLKVAGALVDGDGTTRIKTGVVVADNLWHHAVLTHRPSLGLKLWLDNDVFTDGVTGNTVTSDPCVLGHSLKVQSEERFYKGDISYFAFFAETKENAYAKSFISQARRGFPDLLRTRSDVGLLGGGDGPSPISGTFALTDSQEQFSATGQTEVSGTLSVTDGNETLTVDGATKVSGTASITEAAEQVAASGSVITSGTLSITDSGEIISAVSSLQDITGTAQITDSAEEVEATGEVKIAGTATLNDGTEEVVIIGENDITGTVSFAELAAEIAATGSVEVQGSLSLTDAGETITARERIPARLATVDVRLEDIIIVNAKLTD
jgi:hypothetical protein